MKQTGRPPFKITKEISNKARKLRAQGLNKKETASGLNISYSTLMQKQRQNERLWNSMVKGRDDYFKNLPERPITKWSKRGLFLRAMNHDTTAQIAFLSRYCPERWTTKGILAREQRERQEKAEQERESALRKQRRKRVQRLARKPKLTLETPLVQPVNIRIYVGEDLPKRQIMLVPVTTTSHHLENFEDREDENTTVIE